MRYLEPRKGLIFLMIFGIFAWWIRYHPPATDDLRFDDDARQHVYWTARFQDPGLFPGDALTAFISSGVFDPAGYRLIYRIGVRWMDPLRFSQLLSLILLLITVWLFFELALQVVPHPSGRVFSGCLLLFFHLYALSGGLPRSFALPLLLGFLLLQQKGRFRWAMTVVLLEAVLYPPILLNTLALAVWDRASGALRCIRKRRWRIDTLALVMATLAAGGYLFSVYERSDREILGPQVTRGEARLMAEFQPGGRNVFFRDNPVAYYLLGRSGIGLEHLAGFLVILAAMGLVSGARNLRVPAVSIHLAWTSSLLFFAAHLLLFKLHLPSRYTLHTLPTALLLAIQASAEGFARSLKRWMNGGPDSREPGRSSRWLVAAAVVFLILLYGVAQARWIARMDPLLVVLDQADLELLDFLGKRPKEALIAGHPSDLDNVPLVAKRMVLANHELSMPYYLGYYSRIRKRIGAMLHAYYATQWKEIAGFAKSYGIDAMVIDKRHFQKPFIEGKIYFEPFNSEIKRGWNGRESWAWESAPARIRCFENRRYTVLCFR